MKNNEIDSIFYIESEYTIADTLGVIHKLHLQEEGGR